MSFFIICLPTVSGGLLDNVYECQYVLDIDYDVEVAQSPLLPVHRSIDIPLTIKIKVIGLFAELMMPYYNGEIPNTPRVDAILYLYINNTPSWCTATISPYILTVKADTEFISNNATLHIKIDENAPAFQDGNIEIKIKISKLGAILERTFYVSIPFRIGYLPLLKLDVNSTVETISPLESAIFYIDIENLGNAKTNITFNAVTNLEGWEVYIVSSITLGTKVLNETSKNSIILLVNPPYDFGYHQEQKVIQISMSPSYYNDSQLKGEEYQLSFLVKNTGFSLSGFEGVFVFIALVGMIIVKKLYL